MLCPAYGIRVAAGPGISGTKVRYHFVPFRQNSPKKRWQSRKNDSGDPSPTTLMASARYDKMIDAFGEVAHNATNPDELKAAVTDGLNSLRPTLINCVIDPGAGTESGHIGNLNPKTIGAK